ncbi:MAG: hypothetical protein IJQ01_06330, partial [Selenomonadaceae bacterium]|nr:hypothetical protein [Selenomonadaceae bacterium]
NDTIYGGGYKTLYQYKAGDGNDKISGFTATDTLQIGGGNGSYSSQTSGNNIIVTVGTGKISLMGAASLSAVNIDGKETAKNEWKLDGTTATYGTTSNTLIKVTNVKSLTGLSLSGNVVTVAKASVNAKKITLTGDDYTLALADDVPKRETKPAAWSYSNGTATYKSSYKTKGYLLSSDAKSISYYSKATTASTLASVKGAASSSGLSTSGKKFTLKASALSSKVTISGGGYEFDFASDYKNATITGSAKADSISTRGSKVSINAGKGDDTITMRGTTSVTGGAGADVFVYKSGKHVITDYAEGEKIQIGGVAVSSITTSGSNVIFTIGSGKITVTGGKDNTISYVDKLGEHKYPEEPANDEVVILPKNYSNESYTMGSEVWTLDASAVRLDIEITGNKLMNSIRGGAGNDTLIGGGSNDTLTGGDGADVFVWNKDDGNDLITDYTDEDTIRINGDTVKTKKASGDDVIFTLAGKNKITVQGGAYKIIDYIDNTGEHIYSHFVTYNGSGTSAKLKAGYSKKSFEPSDYAKYIDDLKTINASAVPHAMSIVGNDIANSIIGTADEDYINGGAGKDTIRGGEGNDSLLGGASNDYLYGGTGNDTLWGGKADDYLYGGDGEDVFLYKPGEGKDRIYDYNPAFDTIKLLSGTVDNVESAGTDIVFTIGTGKIILDNAAGNYAKIVNASGTTLKEYFPKTRS